MHDDGGRPNEGDHDQRHRQANAITNEETIERRAGNRAPRWSREAAIQHAANESSEEKWSRHKPDSGRNFVGTTFLYTHPPLEREPPIYETLFILRR